MDAAGVAPVAAGVAACPAILDLISVSHEDSFGALADAVGDSSLGVDGVLAGSFASRLISLDMGVEGALGTSSVGISALGVEGILGISAGALDIGVEGTLDSSGA